MKLLLDARMAYPPSHGIARYTMNLIRGLKGHVDLSLLVNSSDAEKFFRREAPWINRCLHTRIPFANPLDALELSVRTPKAFDLVHFTSFSVPLKLPRRSVVTIHDLIHLKPGGGLAHKIYYNSVVRHALKKCTKIISVSEWTKKDLISSLGVPQDKITVIPNGLEAQWFAETPAVPIEAKFREATGLRTQYITCVSNPKPHKNLKTLLAACELLWNSGHNFELALAIGTDKLPETLSINPLYLPRIKLLTNLKEQELMALYRYGNLTVSPSQYEGYSFPVAESLAMGTAVVLSRAAAHEEFTGEGLTFFEPFDSSIVLATTLGPMVEKKQSTTKCPDNVIDHLELAKRTLDVYRQSLLHA